MDAVVYSVYVIHTQADLWIAAMLVQSQKAKIFQVGKRNIINQKIMDK